MFDNDVCIYWKLSWRRNVCGEDLLVDDKKNSQNIHSHNISSAVVNRIFPFFFTKIYLSSLNIKQASLEVQACCW